MRTSSWRASAGQSTVEATLIFKTETETCIKTCIWIFCSLVVTFKMNWNTTSNYKKHVIIIKHNGLNNEAVAGRIYHFLRKTHKSVDNVEWMNLWLWCCSQQKQGFYLLLIFIVCMFLFFIQWERTAVRWPTCSERWHHSTKVFLHQDERIDVMGTGTRYGSMTTGTLKNQEPR